MGEVIYVGETESHTVNDTSRAIASVAKDLDKFESPLVDLRVRAIILTKLQEAYLFSLLLIKGR